MALLGWYGLNHLKKYELAKMFLTGMSLWFYGYFNTYYLLIIVGSILINYLISYLMTFSKSRLTDRIGLFAGIGVNLAILFYFKYYDFFIENINYIFRADFNLKHILLPLGISFFTFQQLSFIIDRCTGRPGIIPLPITPPLSPFSPSSLPGLLYCTRKSSLNSMI